ncbi:MAG: hypothetical protein KKB30_16145 [Proteobacteria bacterium]|nr:hypothetical protein [Pseudomonadota bacterium]MBU1714138.1 hypothetical protein [Pseudomonadota bacterium]
MKKLILLIIVVLLVPAGATICLADYKDMKDKVETEASVWVGGYFHNADSTVSSSWGEGFTLPEAGGRVGSQKAAEYYSLENSASGGFFIKDSHMPNRLHLEFDYYNGDDWFGDLRYSYKDYLQLRVLPRRFGHNLDNLTVFDFNGAGASIDINDQGIDDYGITIDIDEYHLRLKMPDFPLHVYSNGEIIKKTGTKQSRFLGGAAYFSGGPGRVRASESVDVDQTKQEFSFGTNAHLGLLEFDFSQRSRKFKSDVTASSYDYVIASDTAGNTVGDLYTAEHNKTPELTAITNTVKVHTSHTGRISASATFSNTDKTNDSSGAEADISMSYGQIYWLPTAYLAFSTKVRSIKNEVSSPATVVAPHYDGTADYTYNVLPGVESQTDTLTVNARYSLIPSTNLNLQYTKKIKEVEEQSAIDWSRPLTTTSDIYEVGLTNWAIPKVRITAKFSHTNVGRDLGSDVVDPVTYEELIHPVINDPEQTNQGNLGITWTMSPRVAVFLSAIVAKDETDDNLMGEITDANIAEALREQYQASIAFIASERFTVSPTYTYLSNKQERDIVWEDGQGLHVVDSSYTNEQKAQNFALNMMFAVSERLKINGSFDYTITEGNYEPTSPVNLSLTAPFDLDTAVIGQLAESKTTEIGVRLDTDYDVGKGWGIGLDLRYTDWKDESFDNPSDGTFIGGLVKISKEMQSK